MNRVDAVLFLSQLVFLIIGLMFLPYYFKEGITSDNLYGVFMLLGALSLASTFGSNVFTNTMNREDYDRNYPTSIIIKWSWINTIVQGFCILTFGVTLYFIAIRLSSEIIWMFLCLLWILICLYDIYREWKHRKNLGKF